MGAYAGALIGLVTGLALFIPCTIISVTDPAQNSQGPFVLFFAIFGALLGLMGLIGLVGAGLMTRRPRMAGILLLIAGIGGLVVTLPIQVVGLIFWIIPALLLISTGVRTLRSSRSTGR